MLCLNFEFSFFYAQQSGIRRRALVLQYCDNHQLRSMHPDGGRVAGMPLTAAARRTHRRAVKRAARRANSSVCLDDIDSDSDGGSRSGSDNNNDGPGAALADSASHELSNTDAAACSALYESDVLTHFPRALQLLHDGGVRSSTAAAAAPDARAHPFRLSDLILLARQPHAALPSHSCPLLSECGKRACAQACKQWTSS